MTSPFPGMNPFLEDPEFWSAVHNRLIVAIADDLVDHLSEKYRVEIEKRTYFSNDDESLLVGIPDVSVVTGKVESTASTAQSSLSVLPEKVTVPILEEVNERYLEIREVATGTVVTVLEILSPKNKRSGEGRIAYERKRNQVLASATNLVEIDLLRGGKPFPIASQHLGDYRILICRGNERPRCDLYAFGLRQPIPTIPIPLVPGEAEPMLDLQSLLHRVYDKGRYQLAIDYTRPLQPKLSEADGQWVETLLRR
ncbi:MULTISPECIES: DUF4058 family protein [Leptolyngbya]|uniref:DUF4058 family protein n=1 Tax=Leptolyngbya TaxID=47251 RepID=UPI001683CFD3|nr:DUF4058 family protein [Leptolyngbya sp. FACHB-1624]MBD1856989.1 DUF4058 family protein [Leptolyngbya sp. FACHB-1624]